MCNLYRMEKAPDAIARLARELGLAVHFPDGVPNAEPRDVRITERAPILRAAASGEAGALDCVERRWSWPAPGGKPVFNYRSENRRFAPASRCVVLADGFYEFTAPTVPGKKTKDRWLFTWPGQEWFGIAATLRNDATVGEAFSLLTCEPGGDVAPYHNRQIILLRPQDCARWLGMAGEPESDASAFLHPLADGTLKVEAA